MLFNGEISTLAELISPMTQQEFLDCYTKQRPVFIRGGKPSRLAKLINANDVGDIIQKVTYPGPRIRMMRNGEDIPEMFWTTRDEIPRMSLSRIRGVLIEGASLSVNVLDEIHPKIGDLAQALELEFSARVWINGYVTTKQGGAFKVHYDNHDVIIVQISGSKRWHLYGKITELPVDQFDAARDTSPVAEEEIDILSAGEVLFVPRGVYHRAEVVDSPSFHLAIGVMGETGVDFIDHAVKDLKKEAVFRKCLPRVGAQHLLLEHEKELKSLLHDWVERLSVNAFLADRDAARPTRSDVIPWNPIPINGQAKIWLALRRRSPIADLESTEIIAGGRAYRVCPTDRLVLQILGKCGFLSFDELIGQVRARGDTIAETELAAAVVQLNECGLLNISMDDEASDDKIARESKKDIPRGSLASSSGHSRQ